MNPRARRIVDTAIELAEKGGFEAVRLRDVAAEADVALGTLYRYFRSKEDMLIAALAAEVESLELRLAARPVPGASPRERIDAFFRAATKGLMRRPRLARAILRAAASGDHELAEKVASFHSRMSAMILAAMHASTIAPAAADPGNGDSAKAIDARGASVKLDARGASVKLEARGASVKLEVPSASVKLEAPGASKDELSVAATLQHIWFSCLIGWAGGLMNQNEVIDRMSTATELLTRALANGSDGDRKR